MKKNLSTTIKKNPYLSMLTLGVLAVPLGIDAGVIPDYHMMGDVITDVMTAVPAVVLTSFFYKWNKNRRTEVIEEKPKTLGEQLKQENSTEVMTKEFKPSVAMNSLLIIGASVLGHALSHSFYSDMRIAEFPINLHMAKMLSPTIFLSSMVMFGVTNLIVAAKQKLQERNKDYSLVENNNGVIEQKTLEEKLNVVKSSIANFREVEKEDEVKFKPLT